MARQTKIFDAVAFDDPRKQLVNTPEQFERLVRFIASRDRFVFDYETSGLAWYRGNHSIGMGIGAWDDQGVLWTAYVPYRHRTGEPQLDLGVIGPAFKILLGSPHVLKIAHNLKFEDHFSRIEGWEVRGPRYDTTVGARLYDENKLLKLETRVVEELGIECAREWELALKSEVKGLAKANNMGVKKYLKEFGYSEVSIYTCGIYGCGDIDHTGLLYQHYENWGLSRNYSYVWPVEMDLTEVLCTVESNGMPLDVQYLEAVYQQAMSAKEALEAFAAGSLGGRDLNMGSDDDVRKLLLDMGLPLEKRTDKDQLAVDKEVLSQFSEANVIVKTIMDWREADKVSTTYTRSLIDLTDKGGVIHGNLLQAGTTSGRLSCRDPNYQNMTNDNDARALEYTGKKLKDGGVDPWSIRRAFVVRGSGWVRLFLDYSQIELRVLAFLSQDPIMVGAFLKGEDIHARTAAEVSELLGVECTRRIAKVVNFGLCIAEGQRVLTKQNGLVKIEDVLAHHLLWDGVEWVNHDGLVCRGEEPVVSFDGITATFEHEVFTTDGRKIPIGDLASKVCDGRIAIGAVGAVPVRYLAFDRRDQKRKTEYEVREGRVPRVQFQEPRFRSNRQRWPIQPGEFEASGSVNQSFESRKKVRVFDLLNAGPRHRYTVEGKIVSNSYCMSGEGLSRQAGIELREAEAFLAAFFKRYHGVETFRHKLWAGARCDGCQRNNIYGRTRRVPDLISPVYGKKKRAERQLVGAEVQGTAAQLTKTSMVRIDRWIAETRIPAYIVNTVHDEIQIDVPREYAVRVAIEAKRLMEDFPEFAPIPIIVDCEWTETNWAEKRSLALPAN